MNIELTYQQWIMNADGSLQAALRQMNAEEKEDAFYRDLAFGTGGLRGVIGPGTNRMSVHTVAKASQGLANYVNAAFPEEARRIAVSYDSRIGSGVFSREAAAVFAMNGIRVFL